MRVGVLVLLASAFVTGGGIGVDRYVETFWLYRGYAAPARPRVIVVGTGSLRRRVAVVAGTVERIVVDSSALGHRRVDVLVYLPPRYRASAPRRYPVFTLLDGYPGTPAQFVSVGDVAVIADVLIAEHRMRPMILVMPSGATHFFDDNEWANSVRSHNAWETFVAADLMRAIQRRYRTIQRGDAQAIGGLSEGGYGALNIAFHHPGAFDVIEGWSAYYRADRSPSLFGDRQALLRYNSPLLEVASVAPALRKHHTYIWLYAGNRDHTRFRSRMFTDELGAHGIRYAYSVQPGRHNWNLWRSMMARSLTVASAHLDG
jgi:enterochelin esterase-like enzyme